MKKRKKDMDLGAVIGQGIGLRGRISGARQVELKLEKEVDDTHVDADRDQMPQLVLHRVSTRSSSCPRWAHRPGHVSREEAKVPSTSQAGR